MCGVFAWYQTGNKPLNLKTLQRLAVVTERRGAHAWGLAWIDALGRMKMYKAKGPISEKLDWLDMAADARVLIGHCRYATHGHPWLMANNHPHPCDGGWIVHNGQVGMTRWIREMYDLLPVSECDSEYIGLLMDRHQGPMKGRLRETVRLLSDREMVVLGLWKQPDRLLTFRRGKPLHLGTTKDGVYLASLAEGLPGKVSEVGENCLIEMTPKGIRNETVEPIGTV